MTFINLTPHHITLFTEDGQVIWAWPSSGCARCSTESIMLTSLDGVPVYRNSYGEVTGLPEPKEDTFYIVSMLVQQTLKGKRTDLVSPNGTVRDENGRVIGCTSWCLV